MPAAIVGAFAARATTAGVTGAAVGVFVFGVEELTNLALKQPALSASEVLRLLPWYLVWIAALGLLATGVRGLPGRILATSAALWGVVCGALAAQVLGERGVPAPALLGFGSGAIIAGVGATIALRIVPGPRGRWALAAGSLVFIAAFRAANLNAFGAPADPAALRADGLIAGVGVLVGLAAALVQPWMRRLAPVAAVLPAIAAWGGTMATTPTDPTPAPAADRPDLLLVVVDTLRADHLGSYGHPHPTSPGLDRFAARGLRYTDATSPAPWTLPSFASLQTGLLPTDHGAGVNPGDANTQAPLGPQHPTLAEALGRVGYRTAAIVSNPYLKASFGLDRGYDTYDDALGLAHMMMLLHPVDLLPLRAMPDRTYRLAPRMVEAAEAWWKATAGGPRFLMLHLMDPHKPYNAPAADQKAVGRYHEDPVENLYDAEIHFLDRAVSPFLDQVLADGATVVITADHGEEFGDHPGAYPEERWPPDVRHGHTLYQEQLHVPLLMAGPGVPTGVVDRPVRSLDVVPTLLRLAGTSLPTDGQPLAEALGEPPPAPAPRKAQAIRYGTEKRAVIDGDLKLIESRWGVELYDLRQGEHHDLSTTRPDDVARLRQELPAASRGEAARLDPELIEQLRAVGYVQ